MGENPTGYSHPHGRVLKPLTIDEATRKQMHKRWEAGHRDEATKEGERQYQRFRRREQRARKRAALSDPTTTI